MSVPPSVVHHPPPGSPCWIDLATTDEQAARTFYAGLFGWNYYTKPDPATGSYTIATRNGVQVAGMYRAVRGQLPAWIPHLSVGNARTAQGWARRLGGLVIMPPVDIPGRGTIVHVRDPSGAGVVLWETAPDWEFATIGPGTFTGTDLNTHDGPAADTFYEHMFHFRTSQVGVGERADYVEYRLDEPVLYRYVMGTEYPRTTPAHWLVYLRVDPLIGTDALAEVALNLGGGVVLPPFDTGFGRTAVLADPSGATFAIIDQTRAREELARAEVDDPYDD